MTVLALYIFREDGAPLLSRFYDNQARMVDGLVAPFLVGTNNRLEEIAGSGLREIRLQENTYLFVEQFAEVICAVVTTEKGTVDLDLALVARKFYKAFYSQISDNQWKGRITGLDRFIPEIERLLGIEPNLVIKTLPNKYLDSFAMADYSRPVQQIIRQLITKSEITVNDLTDFDMTIDQIKSILSMLVQDGYIGIREYADGSIGYFTRI